MTVTPEMVALELEMSLPLPMTTSLRLIKWIDRAERQIMRRAERLDMPFESLDSQTVEDVIIQAVAAHARNPEGVEYYDVSVDDAREMRRFGSERRGGHILITDEWWAELFPGAESGAFSTRPAFEPDRC